MVRANSDRNAASRSGTCWPAASGWPTSWRPGMAGAAALGREQSHQPVGMGERRQRAVVGGTSAIVVAQGRAGFSFGDRVLSGLPPLVGPRMERAGPDAAVDRRQGRHQFAAGLPPDGRRRPWTQRADADRGLSRRLSRFRPRQFSAARDQRQLPMRPFRNSGHLGTDAEARADSQERVAEWLAR